MVAGASMRASEVLVSVLVLVVASMRSSDESSETSWVVVVVVVSGEGVSALGSGEGGAYARFEAL